MRIVRQQRRAGGGHAPGGNPVVAADVAEASVVGDVAAVVGATVVGSVVVVGT